MGALDGIRVVEFSTGIAGPLAGMLLADNGAEVVKVEPPGGDPARCLPGFAIWNRNKQSVSGAAADLLRGADICIYADPATLEGVDNAGLIRLHVPPYLPDGTPWAGGGESNELLSAIAGNSCRQSSFDGGPIHLVYPFPLYEQGILAAACAVAALLERNRSARGQTVTVAGVHGAMACSPGSFAIDLAQAVLPTNVGPGGRHPTYTTYRCGDGQWLFLAALTPKFQANAFQILGVGDIHADPRVGGRPARMVLPENRGWIRERMEAAFASRSRDEWLERLEVGDCPAGPLLDREEWLDHPQVRANGLRVELEDPERGAVVMPGLLIGLSKTPGAIRTPAPRAGEHGAPAWAPRSTGSGSSAGGGPLVGYRVLDLGTILAGPYAGSLLAGLGADVVKVEPPAGDAFRETGFVFNRGMRGLAIDLASTAGQEALHRVVANADVLIENGRLGVAKRLRVDYPTLSAVNPRLVTLTIAGFGEHGPFAHKPAFDPVLQAMSGMMTAQGGESDPALFTIPVNDVAAAATSVLAVCLGLYHRERSGVGQRTVVSLIACSTTMQSGELVRFEGRPPSVLGGRDYLGPSSSDRSYPVADGYVRVQAPSLAALAELLGAACTEDAVAAALAGMPCAVAVEQLNAGGVPAAPQRNPADVARDEAVLASELLTERHFADGRPYVVPHRYARFSRTEHPPLPDAPGVGEHSRQVLAEAGLTDAEIDALVEAKAVVEGKPFVLEGFVNYR